MANETRTPNESQDDLLVRTPRSIEQREAEMRPNEGWKPQPVLPVPDPQPGYEFRYIRTTILGHGDNTNVSSKFRQGWVPVKASDHPEITALSDVGSRFPENIEIGGLVLCKIPTEELEKRRQYYLNMAYNQMEAVDRNFLRDQDPRMPMFKDRQTRTQFGRG